MALLDARELEHPSVLSVRPWHQLEGGQDQVEWLRLLARALLEEAAREGFRPTTMRDAFDPEAA